MIEPAPMTKEELLKLYAHTHKFLHRGNLKKLLSAGSPIDMNVDLPDILIG